MPKAASEIFRDFATDGVPSSGAHKPIKADIREWGGALEAVSVDSAADLAALSAPSADALYAIKGHTDNGDLGQGWLPYYYDSTSTLVEDTITYSVITSSAGGRFIRVDMEDGEYDVFLVMGQSNATGSGAGGSWPSNNQVRVWNKNYSATGTTADPLTSSSRGTTPFASDNSNSFGAHFADAYQRATGRRCILVLMSKGGTSITEMNDVGGVVWDGMDTNMTALFAAYPKAKLKGFLWHQGEADQFETIDWYASAFNTLKTNLRDKSWFPDTTPIIVGELYFGTHSSSTQWKMNESLGVLPLTDSRVGVVTSKGLSTEDESFTDSYGAPYRVHFDGVSLEALGQRYFDEFMAVANGASKPNRFDLRDRLNITPDPLLVEPIVLNDGDSLSLTIEQLISEPLIKCMGDATITLPDIYTTSVSSWQRNLTYRFSLFCNSSTKTITLQTGTTHTIALGNDSAASTVTIASTRAPHYFEYSQDTRWRGLRSA